MPFFLRGRRPAGGSVKRKKKIVKGKDSNANQVPKKPKFSNEKFDEEITSEEDEAYIKGGRDKAGQEAGQQEEEEQQETPQEKKVRLARLYLQQLQEQKLEDQEDEALDDVAIGSILREKVLESSGKLRKVVAHQYREPDPQTFRVLRSKQQKLPITCVVVTNDEKCIYSGSKDCSIVKFSLDGKRLGSIAGGRKGTEAAHVGHTSHIYSLAVSSDGKYLASGDQTGYIHIWEAETLQHLKTFKKHRKAVTGLVFRHATHTLFSASADRMVMVWDLDSMAFVENMGGHQDAITGIDAFQRESCITSGARDQAIIIYVLAEDKQLRFTSQHDCVDGVKLVNDNTFVTFGQDGCLALWSTRKKRPHCVVKAAHGHQENGQPNWLTAVAALINTDLIASGSMDGFVRLWKCDTEGFRTLDLLFSVPVRGVINSLAFTPSGCHLVVGVGQEHKLGRWYKEKSAKNSIIVIPLSKDIQQNNTVMAN